MGCHSVAEFAGDWTTAITMLSHAEPNVGQNGDDDFAALMKRLRQGDGPAAEEVFRRYAGRLIRLARSRLEGRLRRKVDAEDVAQSALKSFFLRHAEGQYDLQDWDSLWSLLTVITLRKCGRQLERFLAGARDVRREEAPPDPDGSNSAWQSLARDPTPSEAAILAEAVEQMMRGLPDPTERRILELSLQGFGPREISAEVGRSERTVHRVLSLVRSRLRRQRDD
jgi:RNA polymerase sigma-70 factor, ECF subfamily